MLKFLFVPNNIYLLNQNADGIVDKLGWRNVSDIQQFFLLELDPSVDPFKENDSPEGDRGALTNVRPRTPSPDADDGRWGRQLLQSSPVKSDSSDSEAETVLLKPLLKIEISRYFKLAKQENVKEESGRRLEEVVYKRTIEFWYQKTDLPVLRKKALAVLAIPSSNAAVERIFSIAKDFIGDKRLTIRDDTFSTLMTCKMALAEADDVKVDDLRKIFVEQKTTRLMQLELKWKTLPTTTMMMMMMMMMMMRN